MFGLFESRRRRRERLRAEPFPDTWNTILLENLPLYGRLAAEDRKALQGQIHVFLNEKNFEGCKGLVLTDEIRVTIAGHACLLILGHGTNCYPGLVTVLVYPGAYVAPARLPLDGGGILEGEDIRLGEASHGGAVIVAWRSKGSRKNERRDGHNVIFHEFAHLLDMEDGADDGTPILDNRIQYARWTRVFEKEFKRLCRDVDRGRPTILDEYGATHPAEFFAVSTEMFFERPHTLRSAHPELYAELSTYYRLDPAALTSASEIELHDDLTESRIAKGTDEP